MKKLFRHALTLGALITMSAGTVLAADITANYEVVPLPQKILPGRGLPFTLNDKTVIAVAEDNDGLMRNAGFLAGYIKAATGITPEIVTGARTDNAIVLSADLSNSNSEAYQIDVTPDLITVRGASPAGNFYGIQTLRKSIAEAKGTGDTVIFPTVTITDQPRFAYRGSHLDTSRHFFPADSVKTFIDVLALHNVNRFHWHITDDQGWRLEIKKHPGLTEIGSKRRGSPIGHNEGFDNIPYGGFYTQDEARDIVKYAADRYITIIPEIDLPGHMQGALATYPELGCTGGPYEVWTKWGISDDVLCAGNPKVYDFIDDVLAEVMDIFPSEYVHVGGDECPKVRWKECPKCQAKIKELGLKADEHSSAEDKLQSYVMAHAAKYLADNGRKMIGWDEILEGGLAPGATVMSWRGAAGGAKAARLGHDAILSPNTFCYLDYYQTDDRSTEPEAIGGYLPVEKVYQLEPVDPSLTPEEARHIIGAQCNLWTEYIPEFWHALYMELPRLAAVAETQWMQPEAKDYSSFIHRLPRLLSEYDREGYNYAKHVYDIWGKVDVVPEYRVQTVELETPDDAPIFYTLDGSTPTAQSVPYTGPLHLPSTTEVRAIAVRPGSVSRVWTNLPKK